MTIWICNAFSLSMLDRDAQGAGHDKPRTPMPITAEKARDLAAWHTAKSAVGHTDVAKLFTAVLGREVQVNRVSVKLLGADNALVGQYVGPRLPEGATTLPEGATIEWWLI